VNAAEADMVLSPKTGKPIANDYDLDKFKM